MRQDEQSIYDLVGGEATFRRLVDIFYDKIAQDNSLRAMFPDDLEAGKHWQFLFLCQIFGGPHQYAQERGHPRLKMRHAPFPIDQKARDAWLTHMLASMTEVGIIQPMYDMMRDYFERATTHMMNRFYPEEPNNV